MSFTLGNIKGEYKLCASLPEASCNASAAVLNEKIYLIGGCDRKGQLVSSVYRLDEDEWSEDAQLPNPLAKPAILVINGRIIAVGGIISKKMLRSFVNSYLRFA